VIVTLWASVILEVFTGLTICLPSQSRRVVTRPVAITLVGSTNSLLHGIFFFFFVYSLLVCDLSRS